MNKIGLVLILGSLFLNGIAFAADYKAWIPHFPDELDGLKATSRGDGMNMNVGDENSSTFTKTYGADEKEIAIIIMYTSSGQDVQAQQGMGKMSFETDEFAMKAIQVQGFEGFYQNDKADNRVTISLFMQNKATLSFTAPGGKPEKHYIDLLAQINLKKIAETF